MQKLSMVSDRKLANAVGGKTARPCDNCVKKRARWYCAADDAFLCEGCDESVHSANPLARRHERVRLKTASLKPSKEASLNASMPSWHHSFTRKARTPRHRKHGKAKFEEAASNNPLHIVPEICSDETSHGENEEQLLYRVPVFDPFVAELCTSANSNDAVNPTINDVEVTDGVGNESKAMLYDLNNHLHGSLPSDMDLAQFAADVEILLGKGLDDDSFHMEGLGLIINSHQENDSVECSMGSGKVKVEDEDAVQGFDVEIDVMREPFQLSFDDNSLVTCEEDDEAKAQQIIMEGCEDDVDDKKKERKILLRLDYDGVISAWADQRSPWTHGERPELESYEGWPYCMGTCGTIHNYGDGGLTMGHTPMVDGGREARVSRYREKRRTRLFSKKIRYEVRKLNAEKRPRMKGRFVKRANFAPSSSFPLLNK